MGGLAEFLQQRLVSLALVVVFWAVYYFDIFYSLQSQKLTDRCPYNFAEVVSRQDALMPWRSFHHSGLPHLIMTTLSFLSFAFRMESFLGTKLFVIAIVGLLFLNSIGHGLQLVVAEMYTTDFGFYATGCFSGFTPIICGLKVIAFQKMWRKEPPVEGAWVSILLEPVATLLNIVPLAAVPPAALATGYLSGFLLPHLVRILSISRTKKMTPGGGEGGCDRDDFLDFSTTNGLSVDNVPPITPNSNYTQNFRLSEPAQNAQSLESEILEPAGYVASPEDTDFLLRRLSNSSRSFSC